MKEMQMKSIVVQQANWQLPAVARYTCPCIFLIELARIIDPGNLLSMNLFALTSTLDLIMIPRSKKAYVAERKRQDRFTLHHPRFKECGPFVHL